MDAGGLEGLQLAEAAVDGAIEGGFVAGELDDGVGAGAIHVEGAGGEVCWVGRDGRSGQRLAATFGFGLLAVVAVFVELILLLDGADVVAIDAGFVGQDAAETPLKVGDASDEQFFAFAHGTKAAVEIVTEALESVRFLAGEQGVGAGEAVLGGVAAGVGFTGVATWPG